MKKHINKSRLTSIIVLCLAITALLPACKKTAYPLVSLNTTLNITGYIEANPTQFSLWDQILQRTGYDGFLGAYGSYTVFVPNNAAVTLYLKSEGVTSVSAINVDTLKALVKFHVILGDTISTPFFVDGKIRTPTYLGQYLTSSVITTNGVSSYSINKQATVVQSNIVLGNGIMHVIDHVLRPATLTLAQTIAANPKYTIFTQALKATGFYDTINVAAAVVAPFPSHNYFTVFAQTDSDYAANGIANFAALQAKWATTTNSLHNPVDGFYAYVAYHIVPENDYITDVLSKNSHPTLSPTQDIISDVLQGQNVQLDYDNINGVQYPGVQMDRPNCNIPTTNGVLHRILGDLYIKTFPPTRLDWDVADQPEFRKLTSVFRRAGQSSGGLTSPLTNLSFNSPAANVQYICESTTSGTYYWWNDVLSLNNFRNTVGQLTDITFTTPTIIKGKYKVWIMVQRGSENSGMQFFFDGAPLQNVIANLNLNNYPNNTDSGPVMESKGFKRYSTAPSNAAFNSAYNTCVGFLCGVVTVPTTDHHLFKIVAIGNANANTTLVDMVQFIPFDQNQEEPRYYGTDGSVVN